MNDNDDKFILPFIIGAVSGLASIILVAFSVISQTIKTYKTKDHNFGSLVTFSTYLFSALSYFTWALLFLLFELSKATQPFGVWEWLYYLSSIILNSIGTVCSTLIIIFIVRAMIVRRKTWAECKKDISNWVVSTNDVKKTNGLGKIVMFFRTKLGFALAGGLLFVGLFVLVCLCKAYDWKTLELSNTQIALLLVTNSVGAITWTIVNWPLFLSTCKRDEIKKISIWYIIFNIISAFILVIFGVIGMYVTGWYPTTIFGCIFNSSGSSLLILYWKIKSITRKTKNKN